MSLESVVIAVSLLLGIVVLVLIIYLISRVNDLEAKAFSSQGTANPADVLTKYLGKPDYLRYTSRLYNRDVDSEPRTCTAASAQRRKGGV